MAALTGAVAGPSCIWLLHRASLASSLSHNLGAPSASLCVTSLRAPASAPRPFVGRMPSSLAASDAGAAVSTTTTEPAASEALAEAGKLLPSLDLRVGRIVRAWKHPEADSLYVEEVDVGEAEGPRTICSGLVKYIREEDMQDRLVVVLANLKARNMRGVKSNGMLLAASDAAHERVELLTPPEGAQPGERIWFGAEDEAQKQEAAATPNQLQKKKVWETVQPQLKTTAECVAAFEDKPMRVAAGVIRCTSLTGANVG